MCGPEDTEHETCSPDDLEMPETDDGYVGPIQLEGPGMMVFSCNQTTFYVSCASITSMDI